MAAVETKVDVVKEKKAVVVEEKKDIPLTKDYTISPLEQIEFKTTDGGIIKLNKFVLKETDSTVMSKVNTDSKEEKSEPILFQYSFDVVNMFVKYIYTPYWSKDSLKMTQTYFALVDGCIRFSIEYNCKSFMEFSSESASCLLPEWRFKLADKYSKELPHLLDPAIKRLIGHINDSNYNTVLNNIRKTCQVESMTQLIRQMANDISKFNKLILMLKANNNVVEHFVVARAYRIVISEETMKLLKSIGSTS